MSVWPVLFHGWKWPRNMGHQLMHVIADSWMIFFSCSSRDSEDMFVLGSQLVVDCHKFALLSVLVDLVTEMTLPHFRVGVFICWGLFGVSHVIGGFCVGAQECQNNPRNT